MTKQDRIKPFRALYYNPSKFRSLKKLVCPPYDVISKQEQKRLNHASPYNFCHVLLKDDKNSYGNLGDKFKRWLSDNILTQDCDRAFYLTLQEFTVNSKRFQRRGLLGLLKLDEKAVVYPHEKTHSKPKKDRLKVLDRTQANLSPVFIVYPRKGKEPLSSILDRVSRVKPFLEVTDKEKVNYKIWKLADTKDIENIQLYLNNTPLLIADGHHRFEVARKFFAKNRRKAGKFSDLNYILTYFSPQDDNLLIFPTHRVIKKKVSVNTLINRLKPYFIINKHSNIKDIKNYLDKQRLFCFGFYQEGNIFSFSLKDAKSLDRILSKNKIFSKLDVVLLHDWIFKSILKIKITEDRILYSKSIKQAKQEADNHKGCCFMLKPPDVNDIMDAAFNNLRFPQKTTYFYPKFLSGLILRKL